LTYELPWLALISSRRGITPKGPSSSPAILNI
jgi:hypothetical protein